MTSALTPAHRERLNSIRERTHSARGRRATARQRMDAARDAQDQDGQAVAQLQYDEADSDLQIAERLEAQMLSAMAGLDAAPGRDSFLDDPTAIGQLEQLAHSSLPVGNVNLGSAISAETMVANIETGNWGQTPKLAAAGDITLPADTPARQGPNAGIVRPLTRPLRLLDLVPSAPGSGSGFAYLQESGNLDTAVETAEGAMKPGGEAIFTDAEVQFATIPHWVKVHRNQLADVDGLQTVLTTRLINGVLRRVENQIVGGDGSGENLTGLLHTTGVASVPFAAGVPLAELPLLGIRDVILSDAMPTAAVVNPADWVTMVSANGTDGHYIGAGPFVAQAPTLWGLPAVPSTAIAAGTALVGDWSQMTLYVREGANARISDADQDDFTRRMKVKWCCRPPGSCGIVDGGRG